MKNIKKRFAPIFLSFTLIACFLLGSCATPPVISKSEYKKKSIRQSQYYGNSYRAHSRMNTAETASRAYYNSVINRKTIHGKKTGNSARIVAESFQNDEELINTLNEMDSIY